MMPLDCALASRLGTSTVDTYGAMPKVASVEGKDKIPSAMVSAIMTVIERYSRRQHFGLILRTDTAFPTRVT